MTKLIDITGKALSGEWGSEDNTGNGIPVLSDYFARRAPSVFN